MGKSKTVFCADRLQWRNWLSAHFETEDEVWFVFPEDILNAIRRDETAWEHYEAFSEPYKRIRVAYIDAARKRPAEFEKRLAHFIKTSRENKLITGYGGVDKYYK